MKKTVVMLLFLIFMIALSGCGGSGSSDYQPLGTITAENAADWGTLSYGDANLVNNVWNKVHASPGPSSQRVFLEDISGETAFGWSWQWPNDINNYNVIAYPEVVLGSKPMEREDQPYIMGGLLPLQVGSRTITANFNIRKQATGRYNMAFSFWAFTDPNLPTTSISHEIMIWNDNQGGIPAGTFQGSVTVNGVVFDCYVNPNQIDASGVYPGLTWTYVAFVAQQPVLNGPLNLSAFFTYLIDVQHLLTAGHYIGSVELGNEVTGGAGLIEIRNFSIDIASI